MLCCSTLDLSPLVRASHVPDSFWRHDRPRPVTSAHHPCRVRLLRLLHVPACHDDPRRSALGDILEPLEVLSAPQYHSVGHNSDNGPLVPLPSSHGAAHACSPAMLCAHRSAWSAQQRVADCLHARPTIAFAACICLGSALQREQPAQIAGIAVGYTVFLIAPFMDAFPERIRRRMTVTPPSPCMQDCIPASLPPSPPPIRPKHIRPMSTLRPMHVL